MTTPAHRPPPDVRVHRQPGDGWVECACGHRHWGLNGAAGLLLWRSGPAGTEIVLQHRALWSHHGGTWGLPGGAITDGESPRAGAVREAAEEAGLPTAAVRLRADRTLVHPDWSYTTVLAEAVAPVQPAVTDPESLEVRWAGLEELDHLELLPAFADALPELRTMLRRLVLVVDAANVVGSRPDGWWRDRRGATARLRDHLAHLAREGVAASAVGLPGTSWLPDVVLVTEGAARGVPAVDGVSVVSADGSGDDALVTVVRRLMGDPANDVVVTTADRELVARVEDLGARAVGPRVVRH
ncbi:ADP-ribose pyrophosphatase YjhB (NUDIX family) [Georgenia soli]|uniref:ADP-ribose pyrophosphatase YjhB (NUDIX family) n=1 Tax=Georgenia soli TaxID=638953 RepID=A0A2A9EKG5_9MICO|nr:NUDIX domain-containing protein [Georgenia soli]PFG38745.1 ADP-ribose pyrophosphatase YjhB (NUDIX family) [Georgenia soli]